MAQKQSFRNLAVRDLTAAASAVAGFAIKRAEFGSAANVSGLRTRTYVFSSRHDSRTYFATDTRYGLLGPSGVWTGDDKRVVAACRRVLRGAKVPVGEIAAIDVVREMAQVAERMSTGDIAVAKPSVLQKLARARRAIRKVPVWSSYARVGLTKKGVVGSVEVHWPEISAAVVREAERLGALAARGYKPREIPGAKPESVEAGIIHSPAIGFFMDVAPVVRVVYRPIDPTMGRKVTLYLDRHGEPVARPRDIELAKGPSAERGASPKPPAKRTPRE
jgi:hypothetical protein